MSKSHILATLLIFCLLVFTASFEAYAQPPVSLKKLSGSVFLPEVWFEGDSMHAAEYGFAYTSANGIWGKVNDSTYKIRIKYDQQFTFNAEVDTLAFLQDSFELRFATTNRETLVGTLQINAYHNREKWIKGNPDTTVTTDGKQKLVFHKNRLFNSYLVLQAMEYDTSYLRLNLYFRRHYTNPSVLLIKIYPPSTQSLAQEYFLVRKSDECWKIYNENNRCFSLYCTHPDWYRNHAANHYATCPCLENK